MVLPVVFYRIDDNTIACESAFVRHLQSLSPKTREWGEKLVVISPVMSAASYEQNKNHLATITCDKECIDHIAAFSADTGRYTYPLLLPFKIIPLIWKAVKLANVVHTGPSDDIFRPFEIIALISAVIQKKKSIFVKDIDHHASVGMLYKQKKLSKKSYILRKYIYDRYMHLQMLFAAKYCNLLLLKGQSMTDIYGKGQDHVKNFYDTAHDLSFVLDEQELNQKLSLVESGAQEIKLVYFGRIIEYKGIRDMILTTKRINEIVTDTDTTVSLTIIGAGEQIPELTSFIQEHKLTYLVTFVDAIEYGKKLFSKLATYDFLLATPWREDTPRSVFDSMACGLPIIAYDTYYYKDLEKTGAVKTVPWLSIDEMADCIIKLKKDFHTQEEMIKNGVQFAKENTQDIWLEKRHKWQQTFLS